MVTSLESFLITSDVSEVPLESFKQLDKLFFKQSWSMTQWDITHSKSRKLNFLWQSALSKDLASETEPHITCFLFGEINNTGKFFEIFKILTIPSCRRSGLGGAIFRKLLLHLEQEGILKIFLQVEIDNIAALGAYEKWGFKRERLLLNYYGTAQDAFELSFSL